MHASVIGSSSTPCLRLSTGGRVTKHWQWAAVEQAGKVLELLTPIGWTSLGPPHGLPTVEGLQEECWKHGTFTKTNLVFFNSQFPLDNWGGVGG